MTTDDAAMRTQESLAVYTQYVKPLEKNHRGEYAAVSKGGEIVLAPTLLDVMEQAERSLVADSYVFRIGDIAVGRWR